MHEPLAEQIYFQTKFKMKFNLPLTTNQETPNIVKAIPRRERSVKCTLISFNQQKNPEIHPSPVPFFVHLVQLKNLILIANLSKPTTRGQPSDRIRCASEKKNNRPCYESYCKYRLFFDALVLPRRRFSKWQQFRGSFRVLATVFIEGAKSTKESACFYKDE